MWKWSTADFNPERFSNSFTPNDLFTSNTQQEVTLVKSGGPLGLSIVGGSDHASHPFGVNEPGVFISKVALPLFLLFGRCVSSCRASSLSTVSLTIRWFLTVLRVKVGCASETEYWKWIPSTCATPPTRKLSALFWPISRRSTCWYEGTHLHLGWR